MIVMMRDMSQFCSCCPLFVVCNQDAVAANDDGPRCQTTCLPVCYVAMICLESDTALARGACPPCAEWRLYEVLFDTTTAQRKPDELFVFPARVAVLAIPLVS
eukprot:scpid35922/ scgid30529/ 